MVSMESMGIHGDISIHTVDGYPWNVWISTESMTSMESMVFMECIDIHGVCGYPWCLWASFYEAQYSTCMWQGALLSRLP